jgi:hypothetical protein
VETKTGLEELESVKTRLREHGLPALISVAAVLIVVSSFSLYRGCKSRNEHDAERLLTTAKSVQDLETITGRYGSTAIAPLAMIKLAKSYFDNGYYDLALTKYDEFKTRFPKHPMAKVAELGRIFCVEARGQVNDACTSFAAFAAANPGHYLTPEAIFGRARCLEELGRFVEARVVYEDFVTTHAKSGWLPRAEEALEELPKKIEAVKHPRPAASTNMVSGLATNVVMPQMLMPVLPTPGK